MSADIVLSPALQAAEILSGCIVRCLYPTQQEHVVCIHCENDKAYILQQSASIRSHVMNHDREWEEQDDDEAMRDALSDHGGQSLYLCCTRFLVTAGRYQGLSGVGLGTTKRTRARAAYMAFAITVIYRLLRDRGQLPPSTVEARAAVRHVIGNCEQFIIDTYTELVMAVEDAAGAIEQRRPIRPLLGIGCVPFCSAEQSPVEAASRAFGRAVVSVAVMADNINPVLGNLAKDPKATEDYTKETEDTITRSDTMVKAGRLDEAIEELLTLEKKCRMASDGISTAKILCKVVQLFFDAKEWSKLREHIVLLSKKRGQLKRAITDMVHLAMSWLADLEKEKKLELIDTLNEVTDGKIFVEVEKARLTKMQAEIKEAEGKTEEAANLMQEVQVETFGAMDRREKSEYILEQMRLVLAKKDYVRTQIISKKINPKLLEPDEFQDLKIRYFEFMIRYWLHEGKNLEVSKCYLAIFNTKNVQADEAKWKEALTGHALYLVLTMFDNEQNDMLNRLFTMEAKKLDKLPAFKQLIKTFLTNELAPWPLAHEAEIKSHAVFQESPHEGGSARWDMLKKRLVQHNIKVISMYYDQIHTARLCELIGLSDKDAEAELSEMVCSKFVHAKIDRPAGTIKFGQKQTYTDRLNDWSGSIGKMLDLVENTCHLIQKEQMVHAARAKLKPRK